MKWEYKVVQNVNEQILNNLGEEGWELVAIAGIGYGTYFYFKRPA